MISGIAIFMRTGEKALGPFSWDPEHSYGPFCETLMKPRSGQRALNAFTHRINLPQRQGFRGPSFGDQIRRMVCQVLIQIAQLPPYDLDDMRGGRLWDVNGPDTRQQSRIDRVDAVGCQDPRHARQVKINPQGRAAPPPARPAVK